MRGLSEAQRRALGTLAHGEWVAWADFHTMTMRALDDRHLIETRYADKAPHPHVEVRLTKAGLAKAAALARESGDGR